MKDLNNFLNNLVIEGKSTNSVKNYKTDVRQYIVWHNKNYSNESYGSTFPEYCYHLSQKYSASSVKRKISSISLFLDNTNKEHDRPAKNYLPYLSLSLSALSLLIVFAIAGTVFKERITKTISVPRGITIPEVSASNLTNIAKHDDINFAVSSPELISDNTSQKYSCIPVYTF